MHYDIDKEAGDDWELALKLFDSVDDNGDGELSWAELHEYLCGPQVNLKEKECDELFKMLDTNDDGTVSKFEFAKGFEKFRGGLTTLKNAHESRRAQAMRRADRMQRTHRSASREACDGAAAARRVRSEEDGGSPGAAVGAAGRAVLKVASPTVTTRVHGPKSSWPPVPVEGGGGGGGGGTRGTNDGQTGRGGGGGGGSVGGGDDDAKQKRKQKGGFLRQVTKGVGKLFGMSTDGKQESPSSSSSSPSSSFSSSSPAFTTRKKPPTNKSKDDVTTRKWFGQSFVEMLGLKATNVQPQEGSPSARRHGSKLQARVGAGGETLATSTTHHRTNTHDAAKAKDKADSSALPDSIWVRGTKAEGYRVNVVRSSSLRKLRGLFHDMDADRDGHITFEEFHASLDLGNKAPNRFQRDVFDKISNDAGLCSYRNMLQVLYPGASPAQMETMLAMSQTSGGAGQTGAGRRAKGPSAEQVKEAENVFRAYDVNKDGLLSEQEFAKGLSATGVYTYADASKEFNRMRLDDNMTIDLGEFTMWYVTMDEIGRRVRRNA